MTFMTILSIIYAHKQQNEILRDRASHIHIRKQVGNLFHSVWSQAKHMCHPHDQIRGFCSQRSDCLLKSQPLLSTPFRLVL